MRRLVVRPHPADDALAEVVWDFTNLPLFTCARGVAEEIVSKFNINVRGVYYVARRTTDDPSWKLVDEIGSRNIPLRRYEPKAAEAYSEEVIRYGTCNTMLLMEVDPTVAVSINLGTPPCKEDDEDGDTTDGDSNN